MELRRQQPGLHGGRAFCAAAPLSGAGTRDQPAGTLPGDFTERSLSALSLATLGTQVRGPRVEPEPWEGTGGRMGSHIMTR